MYIARKNKAAKPESKEPEPEKTFVNFLWKHPAIVGSAIYIFISTMGLIHQYALFSQFGINIFDFAEANDFLLAAFRDKVAFIFSVFIIFAIVIFFINVEIRKQDLENSSKKLTISRLYLKSLYALFILMIPFILIAGIYFQYLRGVIEWEHIKNLNYQVVSRVTVKTNHKELHNPTNKDLALIGTTQKFIFFYDRRHNRTYSIPALSINTIVTKRNPYKYEKNVDTELPPWPAYIEGKDRKKKSLHWYQKLGNLIWRLHRNWNNFLYS